MAQTIKHRRGSVSSVRDITAFGEAEIVIGSGSVDSKVNGPIVYIGKPGGTTAANDYVPVSKLYAGSGIPSVVTANYGTTLDGLPYYDTTNKKLYILGASGDGTSGHTEITVTSQSIQNFDTVVSASAASAGFGGGGSGIFELVSGTVYRSDDKILSITGSAGEEYAVNVSQSIHAYNINAGTPTSNAWQTNLDGSYFNNFTKDTDVSEILRFVAGLLSSSAANPTANTKTYNSISENKTNTGTSAAPAGYIPQDQDIDDVTYLIDNGFAEVGGTLFPGKTINTSTGYSISYTSVAGGSTTVQSSGDGQLFGLGALSSGAGTEFRVSGSHEWTFINNQTDINSSTATETSSSGQILSNSTLDTTSNGLTLGKINTVNPAVIPAAFQDGKFASVFNKNVVNWTSESLTSVSASGQYKISTTIGIATGSQSTYVTKAADETIFWAPVSTINTNLGTQTLSYSNDTVTALTLTSGSMSGAPYVDGATWNLVATASGLFEPLYAASTTLGDVTIGQFTSNGTVTVSNTSGVDTLSTSGGDVSTANAVYGTDGTVRSTGTHPFRTDNFHINADYSIGGSGNTFDESGTTDSNFTLAIKGRNREGTQSTLVTKTVALHTAGEFGQPAASGSMGYFGGGTSNTALIEYFTSESYRRQIGSPTALTTAWDEDTLLTLGNGGDLQVKPGYLVNPESSNGYWYPTGNYNSAHYKWYLREFDTSAGSNLGTLTLNFDPNSSSDFATFDTTTTGKIAVGVIFEAQLPANSGDARTTVFDVVKGAGSYGGSYDNQSSDNQLNPFNSAIDLQASFSSFSIPTAGTMEVGLTNAIGQTINGTYGKVWVLIRYTGTPANTLERITVSAS